ncbi:hypothetical protein DRP04_05945 [Archaeoglobales archaeon]|nr:MAG: hypothetical protein DRP04_05945 [Archaeoglobales archaeon]
MGATVMADPQGKKLKISVSISKYLKEEMDALVEAGEFSSVSEIISLAVTKFLTELEAKGKLKSKKAEERIKNATLISQKEVDVE